MQATFCLLVAALALATTPPATATTPFFVGKPLLEPLLQSAAVAATRANDTCSIFGAAAADAVAAKYDPATTAAWRRLVSGAATVSAAAGPPLSGDVTCYVGDDGAVAGLRYGPALVCGDAPGSVQVSVGYGYIEYVQVWLAAGGRVSGFVFVVKAPDAKASVSYPCGSLKGPAAWLGEPGKAVGAISGDCAAAQRRRLLQAGSGLAAGNFAVVLVPAPPPGAATSGGYGDGAFVF